MAIVWSERLETGVNEIDLQHREFIRRLNAILDACRAGKGREKTLETLTFTEAYAREHFRYEESFTKDHNVPLCHANQDQHEAFFENLDRIKADLQKREGKVGVDLTLSVTKLLMDWLVNHIMGSDKKYGPYLNSKGIK